MEFEFVAFFEVLDVSVVSSKESIGETKLKKDVKIKVSSQRLKLFISIRFPF